MRATVVCAGVVWLCCSVAAARAGDDCLCEPDGCCGGCKSLCDACANCDDCAECCDSFNGRRRFLGLFLPSDHCFDRFISPISNPFFFEDPRSLTEVRGIFIDNSLPPHRRDWW